MRLQLRTNTLAQTCDAVMNSNDQLGGSLWTETQNNECDQNSLSFQQRFEDQRAEMRGQIFSLRSGRWIFRTCNELTVPRAPMTAAPRGSGIGSQGWKGSRRWFIGRPQSNLQVLYLQLLPALNKRSFHRSGDWRILEKDSFSTNCRFALDKWFGSIDLLLEASASEFCSIWPNASREYWSICFGIQPATAISGTNSPSEPFPRSAIPAAITLRDVAFQQFSNFVDLISVLFIYIF